MHSMKEIKAKEGMYLTQSESNPQSRIYVTTIVGADPDEAQWRDATKEEYDAYTSVDGFNTYDEVLAVKDEVAEQTSKLTRKINYIGLTDKEALSVKELYPHWEEFIGKTIEAGFKIQYGDALYRALQTHTALEVYPPSIDTASLYEEINEQNQGTIDDPIPYNNNMALESGKYYIQDNIKYLCTRDTVNPVYNPLKDLVGIYVEVVTE